MIRVAKSFVFLSMAVLASGCIIDDNDCYDCGSDYDPPPPCIDCEPDPTPAYQRVSQFASMSRASSEGIPGELDFSAAQALGAPDALCGDDPYAWSPFAAEPSPAAAAIDDWLELTFDTFVWVHEVRIHESFNAGAIVAVDLESSDGLSQPLVLFEDFWGNGFADCGVFTITVDQDVTREQYDRVVVYLDTNLIGDVNQNGNYHDDYNEIDAVELIGDL